MDHDIRVGCYAWVERDGAVLLSHWSGMPVHDGRSVRGGWSLVGGGLEPGETPEQAAVREVWEESGYDARLGEVVATHAHMVPAHDRVAPSDRPLQIVQVVYRAEVVGGELRVEQDGSSDDVRWVPLTELDDLPCSASVDLAWRAVGGPGLHQPLLRGTPVDERSLSRVRAALEGRSARCGQVRVVAVDGPSGSGKTVLATALARDLGAPLVQMDDLFPGWDGLDQAPGLLTEQVLEPLARGERAAYRRWDWHADAWDGTVTVPEAPLVVVEGCGSSVGPAAPHAALRVWVEADTEQRMWRGIARDGEAYRPHWERWARQEQELFAADGTRGRADVVVDSSAPAAAR